MFVCGRWLVGLMVGSCCLSGGLFGCSVGCLLVCVCGVWFFVWCVCFFGRAGVVVFGCFVLCGCWSVSVLLHFCVCLLFVCFIGCVRGLIVCVDVCLFVCLCVCVCVCVRLRARVCVLVCVCLWLFVVCLSVCWFVGLS